jgi:hypothetical protein
MKRILCLLATVVFFGAARAESPVVQSTKSALDFMVSVYSTTYAPAAWKKQYDGWSLESEYQIAVDKINNNPDLSVKEARQILMDFVYSMRDYHVSIRFFSTEEASLPFTVRGTEGRYFIVHIDKSKLGSDVFPFSVGDEVVSFGGKPIAEEISSLKIYEKNVEETDQALAELSLTRRRASRGFTVPKGPVVVGIKKRGSDKVTERQLIWKYTPEMINHMGMSSHQAFTMGGDSKQSSIIPTPMMTADVELKNLNPQGLGDKNGYLPNLGTPIWQNASDDLYRAYIYKADNGEMIGVVRIPGYIVSDYTKSVENFAKIIGHMEKVTDKLVIDQLNNPGGSVFYLYTLASMLSDKPLQAPRHLMSIDPHGVNDCIKALKSLEPIKTDADAKKAIGSRISGFPVSLQFVEFYRSYCNVFLEDWRAGKTQTRPFWIAGVDQINPNPVHYTKPILILVNELDFSGGDFFPTIMQDNKRATIMGVRTAGAGGYVLGYDFPNFIGVETFRVTESLAYRVDKNPIENLGVTPDIEVKHTVRDFQSNYADYLKAVKEAVKNLK